MSIAKYPVRNPRTGEVDYHFDLPDHEHLCHVVAHLRQHQPPWALLPVHERMAALQAWKSALNRHLPALVEALTADTGRRHESVLEAQLIGQSIDRWCQASETFFQETPDRVSTIPFIHIRQDVQPIPVVGVISPWNFPLLLGLIDTLPALLAGCSVVVKPSEITPRFIEPLMASIRETPLLRDVLLFIAGDGTTGAQLIELVDLVCFTGSVATGRKVYAACAERFIPCFLELGGKDPAIVLEGANLEHAAASILWGSTVNCGQSCLSIERVYVQESVLEEFLEKLKQRAENVRLAYPSPEDGQIGPVISERQVHILNEHLRDAIEKGARVLTGSTQCENLGGGWYCRPTVLAGVNHSMKVMTEETFGPIIPVMPFRSVEEAIQLANGTIYGLSAAVFAGDWHTAWRIGQRLEAGAVSINECALTALVHEGEKQSFKMSGIGGTRMGPAALKRFVRQRAFLIKKEPLASPWWF
ncbi:MAG: aldehyde dehydrogenase family protein [Saprospiraceae bacterium]|nr:aldehyde dehydrogenase family protein [Saprospiraceae bacterium]MDW8228197.1 aldehyde dehydrogenase family protein [Saprospiraceae bacterium]